MIGGAFSCLLLLCVGGVYSHWLKGPCHVALLKVKPGVIGQFEPECRADGFYKARQCHGSSGYCWCVTLWGQEIPYTKTAPGQKLVKCVECFPKGPCHVALMNVKPGLIGQFVPQCRDDGFYEARQCHSSTGYCWCVTKWGEEIPNTKTAPGKPLVKCIDGFPKGPCHFALMSVTPGLVGEFVPECRDDGFYKARQCHGSSGYCWCVNMVGHEIPNTKTAPGKPLVKCVGDVPRGPCHARKLGKPGGFSDHAQFSCTADGYFKGKMCYALSGACWCVTRMGVEIPGTRKTRDEGEVVC